VFEIRVLRRVTGPTETSKGKKVKHSQWESLLPALFYKYC